MKLETRTVTVYRVGRGRFHRRVDSAVLAFARQAVKQKYRCECDEEVDFRCGVHRFYEYPPEPSGLPYVQRLTWRYARMLLTKLRAEAKNEKSG